MDDAELREWPVDQVVAAVGLSRALALKHAASLLFTYRCTIACRHCLFSCSPRLPDVVVSVADGVEFLRQLRTTDRVVHIAGGEAMLYWERLLEICRSAGQSGVAPHFFETNASWCREGGEVRRRYELLQATGVRGVLISADPYHQAFVKPEWRRLAYDLGVAVFGRDYVVAGDLDLAQLADLRAIGRDESQVGRYAVAHPPRLLGRAGETLAQYFPDRPLDELAGDALWHGAAERGVACRDEFDAAKMWEIHLDPYGNIQTCCGIIVGNVHRQPLPAAIAAGFAAGHELVRLVAERGPFGYLELAQARGYQPLAGYKQKCHLCWETRKFLRPHYPETFGPAEIYEPH